MNMSVMRLLLEPPSLIFGTWISSLLLNSFIALLLIEKRFLKLSLLSTISSSTSPVPAIDTIYHIIKKKSICFLSALWFYPHCIRRRRNNKRLGIKHHLSGSTRVQAIPSQSDDLSFHRSKSELKSGFGVRRERASSEICRLED